MMTGMKRPLILRCRRCTRTVTWADAYGTYIDLGVAGPLCGTDVVGEPRLHLVAPVRMTPAMVREFLDKVEV